jgi:hypothetical protein
MYIFLYLVNFDFVNKLHLVYKMFDIIHRFSMIVSETTTSHRSQL